MPAQKLSAKEAAIKLGTDARTLRKFLRSKSSPISPVGQGNRYEFTAGDVKKMRKAFDAWNNGKAPAEKKPNVPDRVKDDDTDEELPTQEELDALDDAIGDDEDEVELDDLEGPDDEELEDLDEDDIEVEDID